MAERRFFNNTQLAANTDDDHAKVASIAQGLGIPSRPARSEPAPVPERTIQHPSAAPVPEPAPSAQFQPKRRAYGGSYRGVTQQLSMRVPLHIHTAFVSLADEQRLAYAEMLALLLDTYQSKNG